MLIISRIFKKKKKNIPKRTY